jgi:aryl-alcohol dehydrogenase-like predicted oxidoreductase
MQATPGSSATDQATSRTDDIPLRRLGKTGVMVSMLGLGGFHIGKQKQEAESIALIRRAIDSGITFLDNCWDYNDGESERRAGKALRDGYRKRVFLMTKLDGRTEAAASEQLEQSLQRLQTDVIDLVQIHEVIRETDPRRSFEKGGAIHALIKARSAGKLRFIGFTGHKDPKIHLAMLRAAEEHSFRFDTVQMPLNALDAHYRSFEREVLPLLVKQDIGVLGMKSLADGKILESGVVTPEECLRYALSLPTSVVISGIDKQEVLDQNLRVVQHFKPLSAAERQDLLARTAKVAADGKLETFKTTQDHDGTVENPHWLEEARI